MTRQIDEILDRLAKGYQTEPAYFQNLVDNSAVLKEAKLALKKAVIESIELLGAEVVGHLQTMYPKALKSVPNSATVSLKNFTNQEARRAIESLFGEEGRA